MYFATACLSNLISNTATAVMMVPISVDVTYILNPSATSADVKNSVILIIMAANAAFSTPIATSTNMLVVEPGNYRFIDYLKFGLPLQVLLAFVTCAAAYAME